MVGTSAVVAFLARRPSRARRNAGIVRTIMGLRDIWTRSLGGQGAAGSDLAAGKPTLSRPMRAPPSRRPTIGLRPIPPNDLVD